MTPQQDVVRVKGFLKNYHWGQVDGLQEFLSDNSDQPQAELWYGNHPAGTSIDLASGIPLETEPPAPLMVKLLAIDKPLSIQVHPDLSFAQHNFESLALSDSFGKDEILIALEPVWAFAGAKATAERTDILSFLDIESASNSLVEHCKAIFDLSNNLLNEKIILLKKYISLSNNSVLEKVFDELIKYYPSDPGVLIAGLLEFHELMPGEAIHVPPGCPHEYLRGKALEVMTNSDNVFRMGLTVKPIDIDNSLRILKEVKATKFAEAEVYCPPTNFEIHNVVNQRLSLPPSEYRVLLTLNGESKAMVKGSEYQLAAGEALLVTDHTSLEITVDGRAIVADLVKDGRL
jgi:mannose-6-phosphate isomerase